MARIKTVKGFEQPTSYTQGGKTCWYKRERNWSKEKTIDNLQFFTKTETGQFKAISRKIPHDFYLFIWDSVLALAKFGHGVDDWYKCVELVCNDTECDKAWIMYTLGGHKDESEGR